METILEVNNLSVRFPGPPAFNALQDVSFAVAAGKTLALVGRSGSGKSVSSLAIMGLLPKTALISGSIRIAGHSRVNEWPQSRLSTIRGKEVGMVFQEPMSALNPIKKCGKQLMESILVHQKVSRRAAKSIALEWMERVKLPDCAHLFNRYPHQLSGGQKQRIMIAMAMCNHPKLLIADEPTTALDVTVQYEIIKLMQQLQKESGIALLFITHDLALAKMIADDFLIMENGKIIQAALDFSLPVPKGAGGQLPAMEDHLLEVRDLDVSYSGKESFFGKEKSVFKAVDRVSFFIDKGETLGLVGESGCGKSTLSRSILGLQDISGGAVYFEGREITKCTSGEWRKLRRDIQIIFQDPYASLNPRIKIGDALKEPMIVHHIGGGAQLEKKMEHLLDAVQLPRLAKDKYPHEFSGGQRQRICIARALAVNPKLVICDESVSALDVKIQAQILSLLKALQEDKKLTYLFITHDLNVVRSVSDRIMVMRKGRIVETGSTEKIMLHPQEDYTRRLLAAVPAL